EPPRLAPGQPVVGLARTAPAGVQSATPLAEDQRARVATQRTVALEAPRPIATPSRRRPPGKPLTQGKIVTAYAPPSAPLCKGKSNCPTPLGRQPGIIAEPAPGFLFAVQRPVGTPSEVSFVVPLVDTVQTALAAVTGRPTPTLHSVA